MSFPALPPSPWICRHLHRLPASGLILDLACGSGRHARLLAASGRQVLAVDRDAAALAGLAGIAGVSTLEADLEAPDWPLAGRQFAGIVVTNYLYRPHWPALFASLAPGGVLLYETFMRGNEALGRPSRAEFLLNSGELATAVLERGWQLLAAEQGVISQPKPAVVQRVCALRGETAQPLAE